MCDITNYNGRIYNICYSFQVNRVNFINYVYLQAICKLVKTLNADGEISNIKRGCSVKNLCLPDSIGTSAEVSCLFFKPLHKYNIELKLIPATLHCFAFQLTICVSRCARINCLVNKNVQHVPLNQMKRTRKKKCLSALNGLVRLVHKFCSYVPSPLI